MKVFEWNSISGIINLMLRTMKIKELHPWELSISDAKRLQSELAREVIVEDSSEQVRALCGVDVGIKEGIARAACVVMSFPELVVLDCGYAENPVRFPYVPGLLSFREIPSIIAVLEKINIEPDLLLADAQGIAHPRRFGLASHLGLLLDKPVIGCAKSRLIGECSEPGGKRGDFTHLIDRGEVVGAALRTREKVKPLYVSVGHRITLARAVEIVLKCTKGCRIPEPLRLAHRRASGKEVL